MKLRPLGEYVEVLPLKAEEQKTPSGLVVVKSATVKEKIRRGRVVAIGEGRTTLNGQIMKPRVKVGDTVIYSIVSGVEVDIPGRPRSILVPEAELLSVIE